MAKDYLAVQASTVSVEELFSSGVDIVVPNRNRLNEQSIMKLMCLKYWGKNRGH